MIMDLLNKTKVNDSTIYKWMLESEGGRVQKVKVT